MSRLFLVPTPIGNMEDITLRALRILGSADVVACEDTRVTKRIFDRHDIDGPSRFVTYHEHNEEKAGRKILEILSSGETVALCTDAGMPGISDPGFRLVNLAADSGIAVEVLPGPSSVSTALVASGLPTSSYTFKGFSPRKGGKLRTFLDEERERPHTLVFFESPFRIIKFLSVALEVLGDRQAAVCIEMTKKFEQVHRGYLADLISALSKKKIKGEIVVVVAGSNPKFIRST